ncbi:MAG: hypothetical protein R3D62_16440 [Xanthobacteraceae bacterium]
MIVTFRNRALIVLAMAMCLDAAPASAQMIVDGSGTDLPDTVRQDIFDIVTEDFRDPVSAQFRRLHKADKPNRYCGEVNKRNMYGALVGFKPFVVVLEGEQPTFELVPSDDDIPKPSSAAVKAKRQLVEDAGCHIGRR